MASRLLSTQRPLSASATMAPCLPAPLPSRLRRLRERTPVERDAEAEQDDAGDSLIVWAVGIADHDAAWQEIRYPQAAFARSDGGASCAFRAELHLHGCGRID